MDYAVRGRLNAMVVLAVCASVLAVAGCGDSDLTSVSAGDFQEHGEFWSGLDDTQKSKLADLCQEGQITEASREEVVFLRTLDSYDYVAHIDKYVDDGSGETIDEMCDRAKVDLATESFEQLAPQLGIDP